MTPQKLTRSTPKMPVPKPPLPWRRIGKAALLGGVAIGLVWVCLYAGSHAMPGVHLAGQNMSGKTQTQIEAAAKHAAQKLLITLSDGPKTVTPALDEIGVKVDIAASAKAAFNARRGQDVLSDVQLWQTQNIPLQITINEAVLQQYLQGQFSGFKAPVPPNLTYNAAVEQFDVVPGKPGALFDSADIIAKIKERAGQPGQLTIASTNTPIASSVTDTTAVHTQDEANKRMLLRLNFLYKDKLIYFPEPAELASWLSFAPSSDGTKLDIVYNKQRVTKFITTKVAASLNTYFGPGSSDPLAGDEVLKIADPGALADDAIDALKANESMEKEIEVLGVGSDPAEVAP